MSSQSDEVQLVTERMESDGS
uniref:Uncharacterized protein n=1 Tax=Rhizophora mucronata TaxID=61149 RepID=A0A2P2QE42_RHIMU